jgi:uncharacterized protein YdaL
MQRKNWIVLSLSIILLFLAFSERVYANNQIDSSFQTLIIYSKNNDNQEEIIDQLDQLASHFSSTVTIANDTNVPSLKPYHYVFYVGLEEKKLSPTLIKALNNFSGKMIFSGFNIEQFQERIDLDIVDRVNVKEISFVNGYQKKALVKFNEMLTLNNDIAEYEVLIEGWRGNRSYPILISNGNDYYFAAKSIDELLFHYLAQSFYSIFQVKGQVNKSAFIKIDDVHPGTDRERLTKLTSYLSSNGIPIILTVSPIYENKESGKELHFSDSRELMRSLQAIQKKGATIILSYPIFSEQISLEEKKAIIEEHIQELAVYQLFPVAVSFSSSQVLKEEDIVLSRSYFTSFFSASNEFYPSQLKRTPPLISKPTYLDGSIWFPETLGEMEPFNPTSLLHLKRKMNELQMVEGSIFGITFDSYLELDVLIELVNRMKAISDKQWLDFNDWEHSVNVPFISIQMNEDGTLTVNNNLPFIREFMYKQQLSFFELALWILAMVVALFIIAFFIYTFQLKLRLRKSLFLERSKHGQ